MSGGARCAADSPIGDEPVGPARAGKPAIPALAFAAGVVVTTEFIVVGLLPLLARDLDVTLGEAGLLVSAFALSAAIPGPAVTLLAGRWPARAALASGLAVFGLASLAAAAFPVFPVLLAVRLVQGAILTPFVSLASSSAAAMAPAGRGGRAVGQVNLGNVLGTVAAVPAGVALADLLGWQAVSAVLGILALAAAALLPAIMGHAAEDRAPSPLRQAGILRRPRFLVHLALSGLLFTAMFTAYTYLAALLQDVLGLTASGVAAALLGFGLAGIAGNWIASKTVDEDPTGLTAILTLILVLATSAAFLAHGSPEAFLVAMTLWGGAHMAAFVACQVRVMFAAPDAPAFAVSLNISVCNLGIGAGSVLGAWVIGQFGIETLGLGTAAVGIAALVVGVVLRTHGPDTGGCAAS